MLYSQRQRSAKPPASATVANSSVFRLSSLNLLLNDSAIAVPRTAGGIPDPGSAAQQVKVAWDTCDRPFTPLPPRSRGCGQLIEIAAHKKETGLRHVALMINSDRLEAVGDAAVGLIPAVGRFIDVTSTLVQVNSHKEWSPSRMAWCLNQMTILWSK